MSFPRYPQYKASGVDWLGDVPEHWEVTPLRRLVESTNAGEVIDRTFWGGASELLYSCALQPLDCDYEGFPEWKRTTSHDLLLTRNGTPYVHKPVVGAIYTNVVQRITLAPAEDRDYLAIALQNSADNLRGYGVSIESLNYDMWKALPLAIPPSAEQATIVSFLDRETAKIDGLVTEQRRLIDLLKEKRQAVISHAVTKGLNRHAPMKPSGIEWLGDVPEHWNVKPIRRVLARPLSNGIFKKKEEFGNGVLLINVFDVYQHNFEVNFDALDRVTCDPNEASTYDVLSGDLFFVRSSLKQEGIAAVVVAVNPSEPVVFECHLIRARPNPEALDGRFGSYVLNSVVYRSAMIAKAKTTTMTTIDQEAILSTLLAIPPVSEQAAITTFLDRETACFDALTAEAQQAIDLLQERRTALISAAVTGKIDVRGLAETEAA